MTAQKPATKRTRKAPIELDSDESTPAPLKTVSLRANVPDIKPLLLTPKQVAEIHAVDERTVRNWTAAGLPQAVGGARPKYEAGAVMRWATFYEVLKAQFQRSDKRKGMPTYISGAEADAWYYTAAATQSERGPYVVVPLWHDMPGREEMLRIACAGVEPPATL